MPARCLTLGLNFIFFDIQRLEEEADVTFTYGHLR